MIAKASAQALVSFHAPPEGSAAARGRQWAADSDHPELVIGTYSCGGQTVATLLIAMEEYRQGLLVLLKAEKMLALPIMNCVRAIHDATLRTCSLADPKLSSADRLARCAADFIHRIQGGVPALEAFRLMGDDEDDLRVATEKRGGVVELFRSIGLLVKLKSNGQAQNVQWPGGKAANVEIKTTDLSLEHAPHTHYAWNLNSGATHSNPWLLHGLHGSWDEMLVVSIAPLLDISDALVRNLMGYVGLPFDPLLQATHVQRLALTQRDSEGPYTDHVYYYGQV
ncbi:hypothetical protein [Arthrobacter sp. ZGTC412]|uniref:hypothetical protein n=1 Tax=Arthrobacter sp. ZGTC412 TaxID=2058900 RepID=UPI000CE38A0B|nr:hypothetical protein [Arthrobacter sp. ZGTC412]